MVTLIIFQMISARLFEPLPNVLQTAVGKSHLFESFMIIEFVFFFGGACFIMQIPRVDEPKVVWEKIQSLMEQYKKPPPTGDK